MYVRLAFSIAIHVDPDILIIDEALAVGDVRFQAKCFRKFEEFQAEGKTIIFVSHSPEQVVRHCERAFLLDGGRLVAEGRPGEVANRYLDLLFDIVPPVAADSGAAVEEGASASSAGGGSGRLENRPGYNPAEYRWGSQEAEILDCVITGESRENSNHFGSGEEIRVSIDVVFHRAVRRPIFGITVKTPDGVVIYGTNSRDAGAGGPWYRDFRQGERVRVAFAGRPNLTAGHYLVSLGVAEEGAEEEEPLDRRYDVIHLYVKSAARVYGLADFGFSFLPPDEAARPVKLDRFAA
jgi:lipopolysaccharide transport system ATP-binding protein